MTAQTLAAAIRDTAFSAKKKPWHKRIQRSLPKEGKSSLFDWGEVAEPGARFGNLIACYFLKTVEFCTDCDDEDFALHYLRDKEKRELDFLVVRDRIPWLAIETTLADVSPSPAWKVFPPQLGGAIGVQIVERPSHWIWRDLGATRVRVAPAEQLLAHLA